MRRSAGVHSSVTLERFEELVEEALEQIPEELWAGIDNLGVTIDEWPSPEQLDGTGTYQGDLLLGLYEGVPLTERSTGYGLVPPDRITIFRQSILRVCPPNDEDEIREQVRHTVIHEIAHHFGISDERLLELGAY